MFLARILLALSLIASASRFTLQPNSGVRMDDNGRTAAGCDAGWTLDPNGGGSCTDSQTPSDDAGWMIDPDG